MITIIGYGNPLREDDGLGWEIAWSLEDQWPESDVRVLTRHQLMPELAEDAAHSSLTVFIDISLEGTPGELTVRDVEVEAPDAGAFTHTVTPGGLLGLARETYGQVGRGVLVTVVGQCFGYGTKLSGPVAQALETVRERVTALVEQELRETVTTTTPPVVESRY